MLLVIAPAGWAANLTIEQDVVVKFGPSAGLTVRDGITANQGATFTSLNDDAVAGKTGVAAGNPQAGDWRGIKIESSALPNALSLKSLTIKYAGANGGAAFDVRKNNLGTMDLFYVTNSITGIRANDSAIITFTALSAVGNQTGIEVNGNATVTIASSEIRGNSNYGVNNLTPSTVAQATGNYWGAANGPNDPIANPSGAGDKVSVGVNYGSYLLALPLIDCSVKIMNGVYILTNPNITLALACRNAVDYRLSESGDFSVGTFTSLSVAAATIAGFTLTPTVGMKTVYAQFRNATGGTQVVQLPQTITQNPQQLAVNIVAPAAGAQLTGSTTIAVNATDPVSVARVDFYVDNVAIGSAASAPYNLNWSLTGLADGNHIIRVVATNSAGATAEESRTVNVRLLANDSSGPTVGSIKFNGAIINAGATLSANGVVSVDVSDPSGISAVQVKLDDQIMAGGSFANGVYSVTLDLNRVPNGTRTITVTATDNANNATVKTVLVNVSLSAPPAPTITSPAANTTVRTPSLTITGTSVAGSQINIKTNGNATGSTVTADANGNFTATINLTAEGTISLTAVASNTRGASPSSAAVSIVYAIAPPSVSFASPASGVTLQDPVAFQATVSDAVGIASVAFFIDGAQVASFTNGPFTYLWDAPNATPGPHTLLVTATNTAGKTAQSTRSVSSRPTPPPPPPPAYLAEVNSVSPSLSFGEQNISINGRAKDRVTGVSVPNVALQINLTVNGFKRQISVVTDANGNFAYTFAPQPADAGTYAVSVIHPDDVMALTTMGSFTINRLTLSTARFSLNAARAIEQQFTIGVAASIGSGASGVRVDAIPADQPSGSLPSGVTIRNVTGALNIGAGQSGALVIGLTGNQAANETGSIILSVFSSESGIAKRGQIVVDYRLSSPQPALFPTRTFIDTGAPQGTQVTETIGIENRGLTAATSVTLQLLDANNMSVPSWVYLATAPNLGSIDVGQRPIVQITASPPGTLADGVYSFKLRVSAANAPGGDVPIQIRVTQAGFGSVQFKVADIYTNTLDRNGIRIQGLGGANVRVQNELIASVMQSGVTNAAGELLLANLPSGRYTYRISAPNHADATGRVLIKSGVASSETSFLDYTLVTVEFAVNETTIQDRYEVRLIATYQTEVPAPVIVMEPGAVNIPDMQVGEIYTGELSITNYGLVRADKVTFTPPKSDQYFRIEFLGQIPTELAAKERVTIPYKITALQVLPGSVSLGVSSALRSYLDKGYAAPGKSQFALPGALKSGGVCYNYGSNASVDCEYTCANGDTRAAGASASFGKAYGSCGGGGGPGVVVVGNPDGTPAPWADGKGGGSPGALPLSPKCTPRCVSGACCAGGPPSPPPSPPSP